MSAVDGLAGLKFLRHLGFYGLARLHNLLHHRIILVVLAQDLVVAIGLRLHHVIFAIWALLVAHPILLLYYY